MLPISPNLNLASSDAQNQTTRSDAQQGGGSGGIRGVVQSFALGGSRLDSQLSGGEAVPWYVWLLGGGMFIVLFWVVWKRGK